MKVELTNIDDEIKCPIYPYIGVLSTADAGIQKLVLFTSRNAGFVLFARRGIEPIGNFCNAWDERLFTYFNGKITLNND